MAKKINYDKKALTEWSRVIRQVGYCERCGSPKGMVQLHAHHLIGKNNRAYRHDLSNGVCLCASCHTLAPYSAHRDRTSSLEWLEQARPGQWTWFLEHNTVEVIKVGGKEEKKYRAIRIEAPSDEEEYELLRTM